LTEETSAKSESVPSASKPDAEPAIVAEDLHIVRGQTHILRGLNCVIPKGRCVAILGPNGCGKTTFTRAMVGHSFITSGSLRVLGESIGETNMLALRKRISVVNPTADPGAGHVSGAVVDGSLSAHEAVLTGFFSTIGLYDKPTDEQIARADHLLAQVGLLKRRDLRFTLMSTGEQ
jgi:iron complex transport system ATP-binding protein